MPQQEALAQFVAGNPIIREYFIDEHMKNYKKSAVLLLICACSCISWATFEETVGGVNSLLYGIATGIALLLITVQAVKWKTSENSKDRDEAKKGMFNVILGLIIIIIAATLVSLLFSKPPNSSVCNKYDGWYQINLSSICIGAKICPEGLRREYRVYTGTEDYCTFTPSQASISCKTAPQDCPASTTCSNGGCV
jgi:hypothetical protein